MEKTELIEQYFSLTPMQKRQFAQLTALYKSWNEKINVVSRKDIENLMLHHVLHSLAVAKYVSFIKGTHVMDLGTGGGFPGIPLAIIFPETHFTLIDSVVKKINVVKSVAASLQLSNVQALVGRAETTENSFDFIVSRATASLQQLFQWSKGKVKPESRHAISNGIICLKGGNLTEELKPFVKKISLIPVNQYFAQDFFDTKYIVHLPVTSKDI